MDLADLKACARKYEHAKAERLAADRAARELKAREDELHAQMLLHCQEHGGGVDLGDILVDYTAVEVPAAEDWNAIHQYIREHDAVDIVQKRLHEGAVKLRWDDNVEIPGIGRKLREKVKVIEK